MIENFTAPQNLPFAVALGLMLVLGLLQTLSLLMGLGIFDMLDDILPDVDLDVDAGDAGLDVDIDADVGLDADVDVDVDVDADAGDVPELEHSIVGQFFGWLNLGRVPFIVSLIAFLFLFSFVGFKLQALIAWFADGHSLPAYAAAPVAFIVSLLPLKWANAILGRILPHDETMAVSRDTYIGRVAVITIGECTYDRAAEVKLRGPLGRTHYVMAIADVEDGSFKQGDTVLIVGRRGEKFTVIGVENPNLEG